MDSQDTDTLKDLEDPNQRSESKMETEASSEPEAMVASTVTERSGTPVGSGAAGDQPSPSPMSASPVPALSQGDESASCFPPPPGTPTQTSPVTEQPTNLSLQYAQEPSVGPHLPDQHQQQLKSPNQSSDYMFDRFRKWAISNYGDSGKTKTVTRKKYQRIVRILSGDELPTSDNSKFRFWVKNKGFRLGPPPPDEIGADDQVLYVPTRVQVSVFSLQVWISPIPEKSVWNKKAPLQCWPSKKASMYRTRGESEESVVNNQWNMQEEIHLSFETQGRYPKQGHQWPHKRDLCPPKIRKSLIWPFCCEKAGSIELSLLQNEICTTNILVAPHRMFKGFATLAEGVSASYKEFNTHTTISITWIVKSSNFFLLHLDVFICKESLHYSVYIYYSTKLHCCCLSAIQAISSGNP